MNIFGLMFSFFVPGLLLGFMFVIALAQESRGAKKRPARRTAQHVKHISKPASRKLYVWDMQRDCMHTSDSQKIAA